MSVHLALKHWHKPQFYRYHFNSMAAAVARILIGKNWMISWHVLITVKSLFCILLYSPPPVTLKKWKNDLFWSHYPSLKALVLQSIHHIVPIPWLGNEVLPVKREKKKDFAACKAYKRRGKQQQRDVVVSTGAPWFNAPTINAIILRRIKMHIVFSFHFFRENAKYRTTVVNDLMVWYSNVLGDNWLSKKYANNFSMYCILYIL